jgi:hypothetical protein
MKEAFRDYFKKMGLTSEKDQNRLFEVYHMAARLLPGEIGDVLLSQSHDNRDDAAGFESLWFFSESHCLEAREFFNRTDFEVHGLKGIQNIHIIMENFDLQKLAPLSATSKSTVIVEFNLLRGGRCHLYAHGPNCAHLAGIALEYLKNQLAENKT